MNKLYAVMENGGDGSAYLIWYDNKEAVDKFLSDDNCDNNFLNEGSPAVTITLPEGVTPDTLGITNVQSEFEGYDW